MTHFINYSSAPLGLSITLIVTPVLFFLYVVKMSADYWLMTVLSDFECHWIMVRIKTVSLSWIVVDSTKTICVKLRSVPPKWPHGLRLIPYNCDIPCLSCMHPSLFLTLPVFKWKEMSSPTVISSRVHLSNEPHFFFYTPTAVNLPVTLWQCSPSVVFVLHILE